MKKALPFLFLTLALLLAGLSFAEGGVEADETSGLVVQVENAKPSSEDADQNPSRIVDQGTSQPARSTCPAKQSFLGQDETDLLVENTAMTPETPSRLPKICVVDCEPCNTKADCEFGPCKAIQCP